MENTGNLINILLPSDVEIDDTFVRKVRSYFNVDLQFSTDEMLEEDQKLGIWFNLSGAHNDALRARKYITAAKGSSNNTTSCIFELPSNFVLSQRALEKIEKESCTHLIPSSNEIVVSANDVSDGGIAISLLEKESILMLHADSEQSSNFNDYEIIEDFIQNINNHEDFVSYVGKSPDNKTVLSTSEILPSVNSTNLNVKSLINGFITPINKQIEEIQLNTKLTSSSKDSNKCDGIIELQCLMDVSDEKNYPNKLLSSNEQQSTYLIKDYEKEDFNENLINAPNSNYINQNSSESMETHNQNPAHQCENFYKFERFNIDQKDFNYDLIDNKLQLKYEESNLICLSSSSGDELIESFQIIERPKSPKIYKENDLRYIVIDGSNVAMRHGKDVKFSCRGIQIAVDYFLKRGHTEITVIVPQARRKTSDYSTLNPQILENLYRNNYLLFSPSREINGRSISSYDDRYILDIARKEDAIVVSNDNYRDLYRETADYKKIIEERILTYVFHGDDFMPPIDPLGKYGPILDDFLRHKNVEKTYQYNNKRYKRKKKEKFEQINQPIQSQIVSSNSLNLQSNLEHNIYNDNLISGKINDQCRKSIFPKKNNKNFQILEAIEKNALSYPKSSEPIYNLHKNSRNNRSLSMNARRNILTQNNPRPLSVTKSLRDNLLLIFSDRSKDINALLLKFPCETDINYLISTMLDS